MSNIIKLQSYKQSQRPVHEITKAASGIVEYLDDFSHRGQLLCEKMRATTVLLRKRRAEAEALKK